MFARSSGYAVKALTHLAGQPSGKLVGAREMATTLDIPMPFLWKILRRLGKKKLVRSFKGVRGGYQLARPAETIYVREILIASQENHVGRCILGLAQCDDQAPCPLHSHWKELRADHDDRGSSGHCQAVPAQACASRPGEGFRHVLKRRAVSLHPYPLL